MLAAVALGALLAYAQPAPPADQVRNLLESQSLRDKAWGAWFAGYSRDPALREPLLEQLRLAQSLGDSPRDTEGYAYIQALFDSLIQIPGPIPNEVILPFESSWRPEILILLSRAHDDAAAGNERTLLALRGHAMPDVEWAAVNDLLLIASPKSFYQRAIEEIRVTHDFVITDQPLGFCGGGYGCGVSTRRFPKGFPPVALYQLWDTLLEPGDTLFLQQPVEIYYRRVVVPTDGEAKWSDCQFSSTSAEARQTLQSHFFDSLASRQSSLLFHQGSTIDWHGAGQATAEMERLLDEQAASIQALVALAQERGLVQASGMRLTIETTVHDSRRDVREPMPHVAPREIVIP